MAKLDAAAAKLDSALAALEGAAALAAEARAQSEARDKRMLDLVRERDALLARIAKLEEQARTLSAANVDIETRLDGAIGEIRAALRH